MEESSVARLLDAKCPICGGDLQLSESKGTIPYFGEMLLSLIRCVRCGYSRRDVATLEYREPSKLVFTITDAGDLKTRVIRSSSGTIRIPEIGVRIDPGPIAEGFISNVEGILERVQESSSIIAREESGSKHKKYIDFLEKLERARRGELKFRLILMDPLGNSAILSDDSWKLKRRRLSKRELANLKSGPTFLARKRRTDRAKV